MVLLYLLDDDLAVDQQGWEWWLDSDGAWRPAVERKRPQLQLVVTEPEVVDDSGNVGRTESS